jgi:uncharacterized protein (DUF1778 family)
MNAERKTETIQVRVTPDMKNVLTEVAALYDTTLSEFVVQSAMRMAKTVLNGSERIQMDTKEWREMLKIVDRPATRHARLAKLFNDKE